MKTNGILHAIGNTPLVEIDGLLPNGRVRLLAKLEGNNPGGSVKDRIAYYMVSKAEEEGVLTPDRTILEPTSGNTGIGLAMVAAAKRYRVKLTMPECVSLERRYVLQVFGAELVLTPADQGTDGAIRRAHRILEEEPERFFMPNQFDNPSNPLAHYETTGPEILQQTDGAIDAFVAGMGTGGTLMGVGRRLEEANSEIQIVGVEPTRGHSIQGLKNMSEAIVPEIFDPSRLDRKIVVSDENAYEASRRIALEKGIFVGMSSGAALYGALMVAAEMREGTIVVLLPDRGDRYLSTALFRPMCGNCPP